MSKDGFSLIKIDLNKFAKPVDTLINRISDALGGIAKPAQILRIAKAEAEAAKIHALADIEITDLQRRALNRFIDEETKKQYNMESIVLNAAYDIDDDSEPEKIEDDWLINFFDKCRKISDEDMHIIWGKILAGEANEKGSFSKRTVNLLAEIDKTDAEDFSKLCSYKWEFDEVKTEIQPLVFDLDNDVYKKNNMNFNKLINLANIGLINYDNLAGYIFSNNGKNCSFKYFDKMLYLQFPEDENNELMIGYSLFTTIGKELNSIIQAEPVEGFFEYIRDELAKQKLKIIEH